MCVINCNLMFIWCQQCVGRRKHAICIECTLQIEYHTLNVHSQILEKKLRRAFNK
jgi:hypothetical protein